MVPPAPKNRRSSVLLRRGSLHAEKMKEVEELSEQYALLKQLGTGRFGTVHLAEDRKTTTQIALKIFPKATVKHADFIREYNYSYFLSPHQNIIDTYEGTYGTKESYFFVQEYAPRGSFRDLIEGSTGSVAETLVKEVMAQVLAAVEYMHSEKLVHRNIKAENILLFGSQPRSLERVKLGDFGLTRKEETLVRHSDSSTPYHAPELCETLQKETYAVDRSVDVWALGVLVYYALKGRFPWPKACITCKAYWEWEEWLKRKNPHLPKRWGRFSEKALKMFKKSLSPKSKDRCTVKDLRKYLKEKWIKELKSVSEDDLGDPTEERMARSYASLTVPNPPPSSNSGKRKSIVHQWFATTLSTMSEISEQMVSAEDV